MENGKWKMENGKWKLEIGKWKMENGKWNSSHEYTNSVLGIYVQVYTVSISINSDRDS
jgi:hypothetical protein